MVFCVGFFSNPPANSQRERHRGHRAFFPGKAAGFLSASLCTNSLCRAADGNKVVFSKRGSGFIPSLRFLLSAKAKMKLDFSSSYELEIVVKARWRQRENVIMKHTRALHADLRAYVDQPGMKRFSQERNACLAYVFHVK